MSQFQFSCESVLRLKQHARQQAEAELSELSSQVSRLKAQIDQVELRLTQCRTRLRSLQEAQRLDVGLSLQTSILQTRLESDRRELTEQLLNMEQSEGLQRELLRQTASSLRGLERLRDRERAEWNRNHQRFEQTQLEEAWLARRTG